MIENALSTIAKRTGGGGYIVLLILGAPQAIAQEVRLDTLTVSNPFARPEAITRLTSLVKGLTVEEAEAMGSIASIVVSFDTVPCPCGAPSRCEFSTYHRTRRKVTYSLDNFTKSVANKLGVPVSFVPTGDGHGGRYSGSRKERKLLSTRVFAGSGEVILTFRDIPVELCGLSNGIFGDVTTVAGNLRTNESDKVAGVDVGDALAAAGVLVGAVNQAAGIALVGIGVHTKERAQDANAEMRARASNEWSIFLLSVNDRLSALHAADEKVVHEVSKRRWFVLSEEQTFLQEIKGKAILNITHDSYEPFNARSLEDRVSAISIRDFFGTVLRNLDDLDEESPRVHVVRRGETLWSIARQYYLTGLLWNTILQRNAGSRGYSTVLVPGERILVERRWVLGRRGECGQIVLPGENLWIKARGARTTDSLRSVNRSRWADAVGRDLVYPGELVPWAVQLADECPPLGPLTVPAK